ncbi:MAG: staygreen family protein [Cellulosilyticaceae bacterium]
MRKINPNKVFTTYRDRILPTTPLMERHYTMTHSDTTGDLFVVIGEDYAADMLSPMHDEVILEWRIQNDLPYLYGQILIDSPSITGNPAIRHAIFIKEMPTALQAIRYADREFFNAHPHLDNMPIFIDFKSTKPQYNKVRSFGTMSRYRI